MKDSNRSNERFTPEDSAMLVKEYGKTTSAQHKSVMQKLEKQRQAFNDLQAENDRSQTKNQDRTR